MQVGYKCRSYTENPEPPDTLRRKTRQARGVSPRTLQYYQERLSKFIAHVNYISADRQEIEKYLKSWLMQYRPNGSLWGLNQWGVASMLRRLQAMTGLPCNPHTFRRTFACLLRKAGVDTMTIKDLGRWESIEMVQRYTRSVSFQDSLRFYEAPLS